MTKRGQVADQIRKAQFLHKLVNVYSKQDRGRYPILPYTTCHRKGSRKDAPPSDLKVLLRVPLNQEM